MIFAQFYQTCWFTGLPIEACGDRSVIILDGRHTLADNISMAKEECKKRGYIGYIICRGETFTRSNAITEFKQIT